eukprot:Seg597.6 transcript_id=Seg597.6/GoldUCD/mRNA.D3Y31 product="Retinal-specific ATP-binding cassette transporter" protein_id=Seg597.6/GoldUCD/D3Y31
MIAIRIKGDMPNLEPVKNYFEGNFPEAVLKEFHHNILNYQISASSNVALSDIFGCLEDAEESLDIEDFSVNQTTLENVFINFAKKQMDTSILPDSPASSMSTVDRVRQFGKAVRRKVENQSSVRFSRLLAGRRSELNNDDSYIDDEDTMSVEFRDSNVSMNFSVY